MSNEITNIENKCYVSIASLWEIAIKLKLGKLSLKFPFERFASYLSDNDIDVLSISFDHLVKVLNLDLHHRDPFDRIIIAQGLVEDLTIVTKDAYIFRVIQIGYCGNKKTFKSWESSQHAEKKFYRAFLVAADFWGLLKRHRHLPG